MNKAENVIKFYVLCSKLKNLIRTGWKDWNVKAERVESVAEHVYGVQMLALAMYSEYQYNIDIEKVLYMLAVHELEETIIGDLTFLQISAEDKAKIGHEAIEKILVDLIKGEEIKEIILEFDEHKTAEALFAYHCDKLECDLQCKLYDEAHLVDPYDQKESVEHSEDVMNKLKNGTATWSGLWLEKGRNVFLDDEHFLEVLDYADNNIIHE
jgi:putative hydrolase of HD superfamily